MIERRKQLEREERQLVETIAASIREEKEAAERQKIREAQDLEYHRSMMLDKKRAEKKEARKRQKTEETIAVDLDEADEEEEEKEVKSPKRAKKEESDEVVMEPPSEEPEEDEEGICRVTFQTEEGKRFERRFRKSGRAEGLYKFVAFFLPGLPKSFEIVQLPQGVVGHEAELADVLQGSRALLYVKLSE